MKRAVMVALLMAGIAVGASAPAWASAGISVNPSTASPGDSVAISGNVPTTDCPSTDAAQLTSTADLFPPDGFGPQATRDGSGNFNTNYAIPSSTPPGAYRIGVRCGGGNVGVSADLQVTAPTAATIAVNPASAAPGDAVTITGHVPTSSCPSSSTAQLTSTAALFPPDGFGPQTPRDSTGTFSISYSVPTSTTAGTYQIGIRCGGGNVGVAATLTVAASAAPSSSTTTSSSSASSKSNSSALPWILLLLALIVAAAIVTVVVRRSRSPRE
jgi:hypothetical protein